MDLFFQDLLAFNKHTKQTSALTFLCLIRFTFSKCVIFCAVPFDPENVTLFCVALIKLPGLTQC